MPTAFQKKQQRRKNRIPEAKPVYTGWTEGGKDAGDYHIWVEDKHGKVVFDPVFEEYRFICKIRNANINKPVRVAWNNQAKWLDDKNWSQQANDNAFRCIISNMFEQPRYQHCRSNAIAYMVNRGKEGDRVVIGSAGWKKGNGEVWWEFG